MSMVEVFGLVGWCVGAGWFGFGGGVVELALSWPLSITNKLTTFGQVSGIGVRVDNCFFCHRVRVDNCFFCHRVRVDNCFFLSPRACR
mmetsp:Transcript_24264/g.65617  ORF Transcript_24264/g.65617 Transcript_24264/m.65617 type:complete len:88 (+) Transcript_24264:604-867(+)